MQLALLRDLLRCDWIDTRNNIKVDDLGPVLSFVGRLGDPQRGGLGADEFTRRQAIYRAAKIAAMHDVTSFIRKAREIYGYPHFVNDVGGSLCELDEPGVIDLLVEHKLILYVQVTTLEKETELIHRAQADPKPLDFRPAFLAEHLPRFMAERRLGGIANADPDDFTRWFFPRLLRSRVPRYEAIARPHGYTVTSAEISAVGNELEFLAPLERAIVRSES